MGQKQVQVMFNSEEAKRQFGPGEGFKADMSGGFCLLYRGDPNADEYEVAPIPFEAIHKVKFKEIADKPHRGPETA